MWYNFKQRDPQDPPTNDVGIFATRGGKLHAKTDLTTSYPPITHLHIIIYRALVLYA